MAVLGDDAVDGAPEPGRVVRLAEVSEVVDYDVIDDAWWEQDALPVEVQTAALATRAPAEAKLLHRDYARRVSWAPSGAFIAGSLCGDLVRLWHTRAAMSAGS